MLSDVLEDVAWERACQDSQWGVITTRTIHHDEWFRVLGEEVGEVARALNDEEPILDLRAELIQVAAVAVAWVEHIDLLQ